MKAVFDITRANRLLLLMVFFLVPFQRGRAEGRYTEQCMEVEGGTRCAFAGFLGLILTCSSFGRSQKVKAEPSLKICHFLQSSEYFCEKQSFWTEITDSCQSLGVSHTALEYKVMHTWVSQV